MASEFALCYANTSFFEAAVDIRIPSLVEVELVGAAVKIAVAWSLLIIYLDARCFHPSNQLLSLRTELCIGNPSADGSTVSGLVKLIGCTGYLEQRNPCKID